MKQMRYLVRVARCFAYDFALEGISLPFLDSVKAL